MHADVPQIAVAIKYRTSRGEFCPSDLNRRLHLPPIAYSCGPDTTMALVIDNVMVCRRAVPRIAVCLGVAVEVAVRA